ncbi:MAG: NADPH-dependent glutamate synthase [Prevotellaceae bacterium]|nr:NADPH-dependent glutamate synthase [Prevotellaceae bacterium]
MENIKTQRNVAWRVDLRNSMKPKQRTEIPRVAMTELAPEIRCRNSAEVNLGLTAAEAMREAQRCLDCANPTCMNGCPVEVRIPDFIKNIERGNFAEAYRLIRETSALPAVCGRVCPQEKQCEAHCIHLKMKKEAVAIGYLERFAADHANSNPDIPSAYEQSKDLRNLSAQKSKGSIAVAGSGPAGLSFAGEMAQRGYQVTVFEALHEIGGVLKYGIPVFRLPNEIIDIEINNLKKSGVKFVTNCIVGKTITLEDIKKQGFAGMFAGSGAGLPRFMNIRGENLNGVMSSNEYLTRVNLMNAADSDADTPVIIGKNVAIIGGGNTALDSVRTARRLGAERALIVYRRSEGEMPARAEEIKHAKEEGVEFMTLRNPIEYTGNDKGQVKQMLLQVMELGTPDASGRRSPVAVEGETESIDVDEVIVSVGVSANPLIPSSIQGLTTTKWGTVVVNEETMQTDIPMIFAGGDIVRGGATVILAMGDGRRAAAAMDKWLSEN